MPMIKEVVKIEEEEGLKNWLMVYRKNKLKNPLLASQNLQLNILISEF